MLTRDACFGGCCAVPVRPAVRLAGLLPHAVTQEERHLLANVLALSNVLDSERALALHALLPAYLQVNPWELLYSSEVRARIPRQHGRASVRRCAVLPPAALCYCEPDQEDREKTCTWAVAAANLHRRYTAALTQSLN